MAIARSTRSTDWTPERIAALSTTEVKQLRANAERLNDPDIVARCDAALSEALRASRANAKAKRAAAAAPRQPKAPESGGAA